MRDRARRWLRRRDVALAGEVLLAVAVLLLSLKGLQETNGCPCPPVPDWGYGLVVAQAAVLLGRRWWPTTVALVSGVLALCYGLTSLPDPPVPYAALVAVYTAAARSPQRRAVLVAGVSAAEIAMAMVLDRAKSDYQDALFNYLVFATAWLLGFAASAHSARLAAVEERALHMERTKLIESERAVSEERNRISRELHDIVAHHVSMMVIQAESAPLLLARDQQAAAGALASISETGRAALAEMRRMMTLMRGGQERPLSPQPSLRNLQEMVDGLRGSGLDVTLNVTGDVRTLQQATELTAYRVLQEALTNAAKHGDGSKADVCLHYGSDTLRIEVHNRMVGSSHRTALPGGNGLIVMRERVALLGGQLRLGPDARGAWEVVAVLPLKAGAT